MAAVLVGMILGIINKLFGEKRDLIFMGKNKLTLAIRDCLI